MCRCGREPGHIPMTLSTLSGDRQAGHSCTCCGEKMIPHFSENAVISQNTINQLISESFLTVKGAALFLPRGNGSSTPRINHRRNKHAGDLQQHLQAMFTVLRPEDNIRLAVKLESTYQNRTRYMVVVSTNGRQDTEESIVLGMDFACNDSSSCTMGLVLPLWSDTLIHLDGDGGFSVSTDNRVHIFKPVSVQAMWSALQSLHKACEVARASNYYPGSLFLTWISYYESHINSDQTSINEWNAMQDVQSHRSDSPVLFTDVPTERERTERLIKIKLREIMMQKDLENITSKEIRTELEMQMVCNLREFKEFIDNEMIVILGQMDSPTEIFDHVYLGSEWNASNLEDLQNRGVRYILNVTREIDNFFPGVFEYHNIRVYDEEGTDLLAYWNDAYKFISKAKKHGAKCLVHCKMGVSRSASTVIAYAMKEYGWNLDRAFDYVKERRTVTKPNPSFMKQLEEYQGILLASKQRHNKLWRSHSDSDLSDHHEPIGKTGMEMSKKDITSSAEQLSDIHHSFTLGPQMENYNPNCPNSNSLCNATQSHFEFTSCDLHTGQIEDILNLNTMNGCPAQCCSDESVLLDNCRSVRLSGDVSPHSESFTDRSAELQDFMLEDMEKDALKNDVSCHLLPLRELGSQLGEPPESPDQPSFTSQSEDMSADRIDFLSALEKFVELSQENRPRTCSTSWAEEQLSNVRNEVIKGSWPENVISESPGDKPRVSPDISTPQISEDSSTDEEQPKEISEQRDHLSKSHSENGISVKEIVTEIESFNQGVGQCQQKTDNLSSQVQAPKRNTIHDLSLEAVWEPENSSKYPACEGGIALLHDKSKDQKCQETKQTSEEDLENSNEASDQQDLSGQAPKWCAGSVRRATMEFEERLRQEQEQQHTTSVPVRKNSKNDAAVCDATTKSRFEDSSFDIADHEKDKRLRIKITGFEAAESPRSEPSTDSQSSLLFEPVPEQEKLDTSQSGLAVKHKETGNEHQSPTTTEILERINESVHVPKRIELDHSTEIKSYDSNENNISPKDSLIYTGEVAVGSNVCHMPLEAPLRNVCASTSDISSAHIENLPLLSASKSDPPDLSFTGDSPKEELNVIDLKDPSETSTGVHSDFTSPSYLCHPCSIVLEGATEECTSTDEDFGNLSNCTDKYSSDLFMGVSELMQREADSALPQLSHEDLHLINKLTENIRELHEVLDVSALSFGLPHSSSSDSIKDFGSSPGVVKQRAKEIEARIRQAGLTTPSQMKRSASLAKLGCLELSKDDLSERESVSSDNQTYPDLLQSSLQIVPGNYESDLESKSEDPPGKLCILSVQASTGVEPTQHFVEQIKTAECIVKSKPVEKPLVQYAKEFLTTQQGLLPSSKSELTGSQEHLHHAVQLEPPVPLVTIAPRHEHGKTHPLRRLKKTNEKKRTTNPLYNTM